MDSSASDWILKALSGAFEKAKEWWAALTVRQVMAAGIGAGMLAIGGLAGGILFQAAIGGLIINTLLWFMIKDSDLMMRFMERHGIKIDVAITLIGILSGGNSATSWLTAVMFGGFFTVFRTLITGGDTPSGVVEPGGVILDAQFEVVS
tara:strand:- start:700 stop:1146 length:447 start_codon:yes stop_codon:yes gene_type:complete